MDELDPISQELARCTAPTALLESLFMHTPTPLAVYDADGRCLAVNRAFVETFGAAQPHDYSVFRDRILVAAGHEAAIRRAFAGEVVSLPPLWFEPGAHTHEKLQTCRVAFALTAFPLPDCHGAVRHAAICYRNVTAEIELRDRTAARERSQLELARLEAQSRQMLEAARLKSEFLANMSHELRTPLNAILGFAELIAEGVVVPGSPQHSEFIGHILGSGRQLLRLINDVLDLAKVEAGRMQFFPESVEPEALVQEVCGVLKVANKQRAFQIATRCDGTLGAIVIDPARFKQVLFNYLSNAIKFGAPGGHIEVRVRPEGAHEFRLEVTDDGLGIAAEHRSRLFVEFQQLDPGSAKQHAGTGLGLALTKRLVEALGGRVGVDSQLGHGSTFYAVLPRHAHVPDPPLRSLPPAPLYAGFYAESPASGRRASRAAPQSAPCVLVIDDDVASLRLMETALKQLGYQPIGALNAEQGLSLAAQVKPSCIVLDLMLPEVDGFEILARLRADPAQRETPVIIWTMKDLSSAENAALASWAHAVITKGGDDRSSLLAQLSTVLPKHAG